MNEKRRRPPRPEPVQEIEGQLEGRNAVTEALRAGRTIEKVFIANSGVGSGVGVPPSLPPPLFSFGVVQAANIESATVIKRYKNFFISITVTY